MADGNPCKNGNDDVIIGGMVFPGQFWTIYLMCCKCQNFIITPGFQKHQEECQGKIPKEEKLKKCERPILPLPTLGKNPPECATQDVAVSQDLKEKIREVFNCEYCKKPEATPESLRIHILNYHTSPADITLLQCPSCHRDIRFDSEDDLLNHTGTFKCDFCRNETSTGRRLPRRVIEKFTIMSHIRKVYRRRRPKKCRFCDYNAPNEESLKRHLNRVHPDERVESTLEHSYAFMNY